MTKATEKQIGFINKFLTKRVFDEIDVAAVPIDNKACGGKTVDSFIDINDLDGLGNLTSLIASKLISTLLDAPTKKVVEARAAKLKAGISRHEKLVEWAKENGAKATTHTTAAKIRRNILDVGLEIPDEFAGDVADKKDKRERMTW